MGKKYQTQEFESQGSAHRDYSRNYIFADQFIRNCTAKLPPGMKVYIADSHNLQKNIVMVCFITERDAPMGNCVHPISLHQGHDLFKFDLQKIFNHYWAMAKKHVLKAKIFDKRVEPMSNHGPGELINF